MDGGDIDCKWGMKKSRCTTNWSLLSGKRYR